VVQLRTAVLQYSDGSAKFATATRNSKTNDARKTLSTRSRCGDLVNYTRRTECVAESYYRNSVDFVRDGSHADVADMLHSEDFPLDSPRADLRADTGPFVNMFVVISQTPRTRARELAASRHGRRTVVLL
jgi:hypothetical protein